MVALLPLSFRLFSSIVYLVHSSHISPIVDSRRSRRRLNCWNKRRFIDWQIKAISWKRETRFRPTLDIRTFCCGKIMKVAADQNNKFLPAAGYWRNFQCIFTCMEPAAIWPERSANYRYAVSANKVCESLLLIDCSRMVKQFEYWAVYSLFVCLILRFFFLFSNY